MITDAKMASSEGSETMLAEEDVMTYITVLMTKIKGDFSHNEQEEGYGRHERRR